MRVGVPGFHPGDGSGRQASSRLRPVQETGEGLEGGVGDMVLDAFGIGLGGLRGDPERDQHVDHQAVARPHPGGELVAALGQEHPAIGTGGGDPLALEPGDHLDGGRMGYAQPPRDVGRPRLAGAGEEVVDQLDIVLDQRRRLRRARLAEPSRLGELGRQIRRVCSGAGGLLGHGLFPREPGAFAQKRAEKRPRRGACAAARRDDLTPLRTNCKFSFKMKPQATICRHLTNRARITPNVAEATF